MPGQDSLERAEEPPKDRVLVANLLQVAVINKLLPKGFKFELQDIMKRQQEASGPARVPLARKKV